MICGCPGSGTSLVTKMLRHAGLFTGQDSGPIEARKYHESQCFKHYNEQFLTQTIGFPHAPKSVQQFRAHVEVMQQRGESLARLIDREQLLNEFCGAEPDAIERPWGWKDPRNSATAAVWQAVFPEIRALVVTRKLRWRDRWKPGGTDSGKWYRQRSTRSLRRLYAREPAELVGDTLLVDVDRMTSDAGFLAQVLVWCQLDSSQAYQFGDFLQTIGLES